MTLAFAPKTSQAPPDRQQALSSRVYPVTLSYLELEIGRASPDNPSRPRTVVLPLPACYVARSIQHQDSTRWHRSSRQRSASKRWQRTSKLSETRWPPHHRARRIRSRQPLSWSRSSNRHRTLWLPTRIWLRMNGTLARITSKR